LITIFDDSLTPVPLYGLEHTGFLNYYTSIKDIDTINNNIKINGNIPLYIYNDLDNSGYSYRIRNLQYSEYGIDNFIKYINISPFGKVIDATNIAGNINIEPKSDYKYFDYNLLDIKFETFNSGDTLLSSHTYIFETDNQYSNYDYQHFIDNIFSGSTTPINIYNENRLCANDYNIEEIFDTSNDNHYIGGSWYPIQSPRYKITPNSSHKNVLKYFKPYTYIDYGILEDTTQTNTYSYYSGGTLMQSSVTYSEIITPYNISDSARTMITEVNEEFMIIEKPVNDTTISGFTGGIGTISGITGIYDIINVAKISDISEILMKSYINIDDDYYEKKNDSERYRISGAYGRITSTNQLIRDNATGIVYQDENDLFNLDLFNIDVDENFNFGDVNLLYKPIELIDIGVDKKIKGNW